ncbi:MAG: nhaA [Hyphomicrobiales bacterium]|nr:nhaA [Hyphomicrobiales bacterium]
MTMLRRKASLFRSFLALEASGGIVLLLCAAAALFIANSGWSSAYFHVLGSYVAGLSLLHWINDGLMALFFLLVGLEIKRELLHGQLRSWADRALPGIAALGGILVPALIYLGLNLGSSATLRGWAVPAATDIAFALGVLALLGSRVPVSLKIFLTALAILDDLAAVVIIALFYTAGLSPWMLGGAALVVVVLFALNRFGVRSLWPYLVLGALLWVLVLKSGIHATVAGVLLAMTIPSRDRSGGKLAGSPLYRLEHGLHPAITFLVLPVFGFANAGVSLVGVRWESLLHPATLGTTAGLFFGKQIGVFLAVWLGTLAGLLRRPAGASWAQIYGVALLCGIGFTMSLFIGLLAFPDSPEFQDAVKIGVLAGSGLAALFGALLLRLAPAGKQPA